MRKAGLDASHFRFHDGARAEPVMVAYGITADGAPRLLAVEAISAESHDAVVAFLRGLLGRGLRPPLLVVTDGAPGLISAVEQVLPDSLRQRCVIPLRRPSGYADVGCWIIGEGCVRAGSGVAGSA